jgi:hypothetical protein
MTDQVRKIPDFLFVSFQELFQNQRLIVLFISSSID